MLESDDFGAEVRTDLALASQIGITAVPTFVLDQKYGVSCAQGVEPILKAIRYAWEDQGNRPEPFSGGCRGGCCAGACGSADATGADGSATVEDEVDAATGCGGGGCGGMCGTHEGAATH